MKNIKKTGKLTSIILAACLISGTIPVHTNYAFLEKSKTFVSEMLTNKNLKKVAKNASKTLNKTSSVLRRFFPTNYGIRAIASSLFIAKNITKFYNLRNDVKSGVLKHIPFYLENTGSLLQSFSNFDPFGVAFSGIKLLLGKKGIKTVSNIFSETFINPIKEKFIGPEGLQMLELEKQEQKEYKKKLKESYIKELKESKESFFFDFITDSYNYGGIQSIAESLSIASNGFSFYNKENKIKSKAKSNIPFYLKNTGSLLTSAINGDLPSSVLSISKMAIGKRRTKYVANGLKKITPKFIQPMFFEADKTTNWFWKNKSWFWN